MNMKPEAILFDMDGVLVDSLDSWLKSLNSALREYNQDEISREEFIGKYWGHDLYENLEKMGLDESIGRFCSNIYGKHVNNIRIYPDTKNTLNQLKDYKKGVITNTPKDCARQILKEFNIGGYFEVVVTSDEVSKGKPHPEIVLKACKLLQVKPEKAVMIGDTDSDVKAGHAAGCTVIGLNVKADYTVKNLSEVTKIIFHQGDGY